MTVAILLGLLFFGGLVCFWLLERTERAEELAREALEDRDALQRSRDRYRELWWDELRATAKAEGQLADIRSALFGPEPTPSDDACQKGDQ